MAKFEVDERSYDTEDFSDHQTTLIGFLSITKGRDTLSSTQAYAAAMKKAKHRSVIIVTDPYHCYRSVKMATDLGLTASCDPVKTGPASVTNSGYKYLARETGAYLAYITVGRLGIKLSDRLFAENLYS